MADPHYELGDFRVFNVALGLVEPSCTMGSQHLPAKQQTEERHDGSDMDTDGNESNACNDDDNTCQQLLPRLCVHNESANDQQESTMHLTSRRAAADTKSFRSLRSTELPSEWPRLSGAQPFREFAEQPEN